MKENSKQIAVIGASHASDEEIRAARTVGMRIAELGFTLLSGGGKGVMEASCQGAKEAGGLTIGILPGIEGNQYLDIKIKTGMGQARNVILVESADAIIAVGGEYGTLSEIALALKTGKFTFGLMTWDIPGIILCSNPEEVIRRVLLII